MGITIIELHLAAARYPELRPAFREWGRAYARIARQTLTALGSRDPAADAALLMNTINGLVIGQLALPRRDFEARILRPAVVRLLLTIGDRGSRVLPSEGGENGPAQPAGDGAPVG